MYMIINGFVFGQFVYWSIIGQLWLGFRLGLSFGWLPPGGRLILGRVCSESPGRPTNGAGVAASSQTSTGCLRQLRYGFQLTAQGAAP